MSIMYDHSSEDGTERFNVDLGDGRVMTVKVTGEGIIMDVYALGQGIDAALARVGAGEDLVSVLDSPPDENGPIATVGMMFDEWADWIVGGDFDAREALIEDEDRPSMLGGETE